MASTDGTQIQVELGTGQTGRVSFDIGGGGYSADRPSQKDAF